MKDCNKIHPLLSLYIEEQLSSTERTQVDKHLSVCVTARKELEHFRHLLDGLKSMPEPPAPADLHGKIMARLGKNVIPLPKPHGFWGLPGLALAAAVVVVFLMLKENPDWRETLRVHRPNEARDELTAGAPASKAFAPPEPAPAAQAPVKVLAAKKKQAAVMGGYASNSPSRGDLEDKELVMGLNKDSRLKKLEERKMESASGFAASQPSAGKPLADAVGAAAPPPAAAAKPLAEADLVKKEAVESAVGGNAAPAESLDQSLKPLTYSREQSVLSWSGNNGPAAVEQQSLMTDADTFQKQWGAFYKTLPVPAVDFTNQAVVYLTAGEEPTAGYSIHLSRLEEKTDQLVIHYRVEPPAPGAVTAQMLTHPWAMQVIPKPSKPAVFLKD